jgi:acetylornithine deacetylase/succinyl-diaminopimelate desuccinylase-like protein
MSNAAIAPSNRFLLRGQAAGATGTPTIGVSVGTGCHDATLAARLDASDVGFGTVGDFALGTAHDRPLLGE